MWNQQQFVRELQGLLRIPTEYDPRTVGEGMPYGAGVAQGLAYVRDMALRDGFTVREYDGHAVAVLLGEGPARVEAVCHVDVVPAGGGWSVPPYGAVVKDGCLWGRGAQDMKTALWLCYQALREIRARGIPLRKQLRLVVGADEERSMRDIVFYLERDGLPDFAFTPDGGFPLCLGEKGDLVLYLDAAVASRVRRLEAGRAANIICEECALTLDPADLPAVTRRLEELGWRYALEAEPPATVRIYGKAAHASMPHLGDNALLKGLTLIEEVFQEPWARQLCAVFSDPLGGGLELLPDYPPMGYASVGLNRLTLEDGNLHGEVDIRFPVPLTAEELTRRVSDALQGFSVRNVYEEPVLLHEREQPAIRALWDVYRAHCPQDPSEPYISGGVTYAKVYSGRCVAYGPRQAGDSTPVLAHQAEERVPLAPLEALCSLYADALVALSEQ